MLLYASRSPGPNARGKDRGKFGWLGGMLLLGVLPLCSLWGQQPAGPGFNPGVLGPLALPPMQVAPTRIGEELEVRLAGETHFSPQEASLAPYLELNSPVAPGRVMLRAWYRPVEVWRTTAALAAQRAAAERTGANPGDVYTSTVVQVLRQERWPLNLTFEAGVKTTTGKGDNNARHLNAPAYWLGLAFGRQWVWPTRWLQRLSLEAQGGFLAWQTGLRTQNDAPYYGAALAAQHRRWCLRLAFAGYVGWQPGPDAPQVLRLELERMFPLGESELGVYGHYQYALQHTTTHRLQLGLVWRWSPLPNLHRKKGAQGSPTPSAPLAPGESD